VKILGLDLSLTGTGMSDGQTTWLIASKGSKGDSLATRNRRLGGIRGEVLSHCYDADLVVVEAPAFASRMGSAHDRSGLWWLIVADLHDRGTVVAEVPPTVLKRYATGRGNADKGAMTDAAARRLPHVDTRGNDNRVDALWLSALGHAHFGLDLVDLPAAHRTALGSVAWPPHIADAA